MQSDRPYSRFARTRSAAPFDPFGSVWPPGPSPVSPSEVETRRPDWSAGEAVDLGTGETFRMARLDTALILTAPALAQAIADYLALLAAFSNRYGDIAKQATGTRFEQKRYANAMFPTLHAIAGMLLRANYTLTAEQLRERTSYDPTKAMFLPVHASMAVLLGTAEIISALPPALINVEVTLDDAERQAEAYFAPFGPVAWSDLKDGKV